MSRGKNSEVGDETVAANGYCYVRTENGWVLKHHLIAAKKYERKINTSIEQVYFADKDRTNFDLENILVKEKNMASSGKRRARILARIAELQAELEFLED